MIYDCCMTFFVYGFLGWCTEVAFAAVKERRFVNRGFLNGPICPIYGVGVTLVLFLLTPIKEHWILLYLTSVVMVTVLEGLTGYVLDKIFHNKWWDYSKMPLNIGGYVCLLFSLVWGVACIAIVELIHPLIFRVISWIPQIAGVVVLVILGIVLAVDLYVTVSGIFKMNHRLESMERIAAELHEISDQIGEDIYKGVTTALEMGEESRQKLEESRQKLEESRQKLEESRQNLREMKEDFVEGVQDAREELEERIAALKEKYKALESKETFISRRLVKAFPKMQPEHYKEQLKKMQIRLNTKKEKNSRRKELNSDEK